MNKTHLSRRAICLLEQYARYYAETRSCTPPRHALLANKLSVTEQAISNILPELQAAGLMTESRHVTAAGYAFLRNHGGFVTASIPIAGTVQAGRSESETLAQLIENYGELAYTEVSCLSIGDERKAGSTVALRVRGNSMEGVRIFEGDYLIVELFSEDEGPKDGDMIVTFYVPMADVLSLRNEDDLSCVEEEGPTVKYYYKKGDHFRLTPCRSDQHVKYEIVAAQVHPIGRVVSVHRNLC